MKKIVLLPLFVCCLIIMTSMKADRIYYNEVYRPQYHFSPERNFMGSPAGTLFYEGEYHLFYQHNPKGTESGYSHWGHAVSKDLLHWEHRPIAIFPDNLSEDRELCTALPGSIIVDNNNVLNLQKNDHKTIVIFYTSHLCGQRMAYSTDGGKSWQKYAANPIMTNQETEEARHPKVLWHEASGKWVMALYRKLDSDDRKRGFSFYTSSNLVNWEFQSHLAGFLESPDLVELHVNNRPDDTRWVIFEADGSYIIGNFDGKTFIPESIRMKSDFGKNYRGSITWNNLPQTEGRVVQIAAMTDGEWSGMPFHGQMTFPSELSLKKFNAGIFLIRQPAREIEKLHQKGTAWKNENLIPGIGQNLVKKIEGDCMRIKGRFDLKTCETFGFMLRVGKKNQGVEMVYSVKRQTLSILGQTIPLEPVDNKIYLDILLDRASVEVFANNGRSVVSNLYWNQEKDREYVLFNTGGELLVEELEIFPIASTWEEEK